MKTVSIHEWRSDPVALGAAAERLNDSVFQEMLAVVEQESPASQPLPLWGTNDTDKAMALGMEYGYRRALNNLKLLARPRADEPDNIPSTYAAPESESD